VFFSALNFFNDQASDNIIESYKKLLESQRVIHNNTLKMLANAVKENNSENLKEIVDFIDEHYGEDDNNDSN
jgi:phosphopantothenate synthetase